MIKKVIIQKKDIDFDIEKIKGISKADVFDSHIEIDFEVDE